MNCPACDATVVANAHYCHACGTSLFSVSYAHPGGGEGETDRLPGWLKEDVEAASRSDSGVGSHSARPSWPRPIPDGGLSQSMPAWLSPDTSNHDGTALTEDTPRPPEAFESGDVATLAVDEPAPLDVTNFLSADDLPSWIRRIADPASTAPVSKLEPALRRISGLPSAPPSRDSSEPVDQVHPVNARAVAAPDEPEGMSGTVLRHSSSVSPHDSTVRGNRGVSSPEIKTRALSRQPRNDPGLPGGVTDFGQSSKQSNRVSRHLLLFIAVLAAVAIAGYAIYLASF